MAGLNVPAAALGSVYPPNVYNADPRFSQRWRTKVAAARQGDARAILAIAGDSTSSGSFAGLNSANTGQAYANGARRRGPSRLAAKFAAAGLPINLNGTSIGAAGGYPVANATAFDPLVTAVSGFSPGSYGFGQAWGISTGSGSITYTLPACTNIDIYWMNTGNAGAVTYSVDGGAATTFNQSTTVSTSILSLTGLTLGSHTLNITYVSGIVFLIGVNSYNIAIPAIDVLNGGFSGAKTSDFANSSNYERGTALKYINPDLTLINLGINDMAGSMALATSMANLTTLAGYARTNGGDIALVVPHPLATSSASTATQAAYQQAVIALGTTLNCPVFDLYGRGNGDWQTASNQGRMADNLHPNGPGYDDLWTWLGSQLLGMI